MTRKAARRFLNRNKWNMGKDNSNAFWKRVRLCKMILGDIRFRKFEL